MPALRIGTRGSPLALAQAREVRRRLAEAWPDLAADEAVEIVVIRTSGDRIQDRPLAEIGGKGLFTKEIEEALLAGAIDLAVHSLKDVPTFFPDGLALGAVLPREDPRDVLLSRGGGTLSDLPKGAVVGTSSLRRRAQVLARRSDLTVVDLRGNVDTRLGRLAAGEIDATLLASAGLARLGRRPAEGRLLPVEEMLPAVAQGAIGVEIRAEAAATSERLPPLNDPDSALCVAAERAALAELDGSCRTPIAALAQVVETGTVRLRALLAAPDGSRVEHAEGSAATADAASLGSELGRRIRAAAPDLLPRS